MLMRHAPASLDMKATIARSPCGASVSKFDAMRLHRVLIVVGLDPIDGRIEELAEARVLRPASRNSTRVYAYARVREPSRWRGGNGWTDGGGYHMASAALAAALERAGFDLSMELDGRGDARMESAMLACARCCNPDHTRLTSLFIA